MYGPTCVSLHKHSRIPPIQCMHVKAAIWEASKVAKNTLKLVTYTKIQSSTVSKWLLCAKWCCLANSANIMSTKDAEIWAETTRSLRPMWKTEETTYCTQSLIVKLVQRKPNYNKLKWEKLNFGKVKMEFRKITKQISLGHNNFNTNTWVSWSTITLSRKDYAELDWKKPKQRIFLHPLRTLILFLFVFVTSVVMSVPQYHM